MSLWDKIKCRVCGHWRIRHTGTHVKGSRTACHDCGCRAFEFPP
jgi:hypothetical protein